MHHGIVCNELTEMIIAEIRTEAVMQALALHSKKQHIPMPSKRTSAVYHPQLPRRTETTTGTTGLIECVYEINIEICSNIRVHIPL